MPWRRIGEWRYRSTYSLTSALDGGEWSASRAGRFTARKRAPGTHWIGACVAPRALLDAVVKRRIPSPPRESNSRTPIVHPVAQRYTDWAITALYYSQIMWYLVRDHRPQVTYGWFSVVDELDYGSQFTKSLCHWRNIVSLFLFYYQSLSIFCFHNSKSRKSSFAQVCCYKNK
jgi:hypothetical protein